MQSSLLLPLAFFPILYGPMRFMSIPLAVFTIWMVIDCVMHQRDFYWYWVIMGVPFIGPMIYYYVFKWEGSRLEHLLASKRCDRATVAELTRLCHQLDQAVNWEELGDALWKMGKLPEAERAYREALRKDTTLLDARARLGYTLIDQQKAEEAWPLLEEVLVRDPQHDQDLILWKAARCKVQLRDFAAARDFYERFLARHSYYETQVEFAEFLAAIQEKEAARQLCTDVIADIENSPKYVKRRNWRWKGRAKRVLRLAR